MWRLTPFAILCFNACALFGQTVGAHVFIHVAFSVPQSAPVSGRLLVFMKRGTGDKEVSIDEFHPGDTWVAAKDVHDLKPGASVDVDGADVAFPASFHTMPAGNWEAQAVLDPTGSYNYSGRGPDDWVGPVVSLNDWSPKTGAGIQLALTEHAPENPQAKHMRERAESELAPGHVEEQEMVSPVLSRFWGKPISVRAYVVLPPGYSDKSAERYPTAYWTHGFGGPPMYALFMGGLIAKRMRAGSMPPMIWVMLVESCPQGTHEFADSANDGPWATALTTEFIPKLEQAYRMDGRPAGRLLNGHSSGGWATLQLQINYPNIFGGTWSTSPDPSDFHDFTGPDLYAPQANVFRNGDGTARPIMRDKGQVIATLEQFTHLEDVLGTYGGQIRSFDYVFSTRSAAGTPEFMFDHQTGDVFPKVVAYWHDHYDLAFLTESSWPKNGAALRGRIHLTVGTADTFYLDGAAHKFEARLTAIGAEPHFTYLPGRTHFDVYEVGKDRTGLFDTIGAEMYATARPGTTWNHSPVH